jgi:hypothetical protein
VSHPDSVDVLCLAWWAVVSPGTIEEPQHEFLVKLVNTLTTAEDRADTLVDVGQYVAKRFEQNRQEFLNAWVFGLPWAKFQLDCRWLGSKLIWRYPVRDFSAFEMGVLLAPTLHLKHPMRFPAALPLLGGSEVARFLSPLANLGGGTSMGTKRANLHLFALKKNWQQHGVLSTRFWRRSSLYMWKFRGIYGTLIVVRLLPLLAGAFSALWIARNAVCVGHLWAVTRHPSEQPWWELCLRMGQRGRDVLGWQVLLKMVHWKEAACYDTTARSFNATVPFAGSASITPTPLALLVYLMAVLAAALVFARFMRLHFLFRKSMIPRQPFLLAKMVGSAMDLREPTAGKNATTFIDASDFDASAAAFISNSKQQQHREHKQR